MQKVVEVVDFFKKIVFCFVLCSLIRISDSVALDACGAYSSLASLKKILSLERKNKKNRFLFCPLLTYSYLCKK